MTSNMSGGTNDPPDVDIGEDLTSDDRRYLAECMNRLFESFSDDNDIVDDADIAERAERNEMNQCVVPVEALRGLPEIEGISYGADDSGIAVRAERYEGIFQSSNGSSPFELLGLSDNEGTAYGADDADIAERVERYEGIVQSSNGSSPRQWLGFSDDNDIVDDADIAERAETNEMNQCVVPVEALRGLPDIEGIAYGADDSGIAVSAERYEGIFQSSNGSSPFELLGLPHENDDVDGVDDADIAESAERNEGNLKPSFRCSSILLPDTLRTPAQLGILTKTPKDPSFATLQQRLESFQATTQFTFTRKQDLAKAGFRYEGPEDKVRCFFCEGSVRHWKGNDIPINEHRKLYPDSEFVKSVYETPSVISRNIPPIRRSSKINPLVESALMNAGYTMQQAHEAYDLLPPEKRAQNYDVDDIIAIINGKDDAVDDNSDLDAVNILSENKELKAIRECVICVDGPRDMLFLPCEHLISCSMCSPNFNSCPVCRTGIQGRVKVQFATLSDIRDTQAYEGG